jgi:teichuronic acid biosynthesis glycosyltransferase TuaH
VKRSYPRLPGDWNDLTVVWGLAGWDATRLGSQALAEAMAADGPVLYVDPLLSVARAAREGHLLRSLGSARLELLGPRLARVTPLGPPKAARTTLLGGPSMWMGRSLRRAVEALGGSVRAVISGIVSYQPFGWCGEQVRIFWASDDFAAGAGLFGLSRDQLEQLELDAARQADLIVCVSPPLVEKWQALGFDPILVPNGCDAEHLGRARVVEPAADVQLPRPIVGMSGQLTTRIDPRLLEAIADRGHSLLLVGRLRPDLAAEDIEALLRRPNVQWVDFRPFAELPAYLAAMDVGVVPYADDGFNRASFPLKTLDYLAAGLRVVSTDLPAVRWLETDLVDIAATSEAFADAVDRAVERPIGPGEVERRLAFAAQHSWTRRADDFDEEISKVLARPASVRSA